MTPHGIAPLCDTRYSFRTDVLLKWLSAPGRIRNTDYPPLSLMGALAVFCVSILACDDNLLIPRMPNRPIIAWGEFFSKFRVLRETFAFSAPPPFA